MTVDEISKLEKKKIENIKGKFNKIKVPRGVHNKKDVCLICKERLISEKGCFDINLATLILNDHCFTRAQIKYALDKVFHDS